MTRPRSTFDCALGESQNLRGVAFEVSNGRVNLCESDLHLSSVNNNAVRTKDLRLEVRS